MIDPIDAVKHVLGFPKDDVETAQEMTPRERLEAAADVLLAAERDLVGRERGRDFRVHPYERLLQLADQITGADRGND